MKLKKNPGMPDLNRKVYIQKINIYSDVLSLATSPDRLRQEILNFFQMFVFDEGEDEESDSVFYGFTTDLIDFNTARVKENYSYWNEEDRYYISVEWAEPLSAYEARVDQEQKAGLEYYEWFNKNKTLIEHEKYNRETKRLEKQLKRWTNSLSKAKTEYDRCQAKVDEWQNKLDNHLENS